MISTARQSNRSKPQTPRATVDMATLQTALETLGLSRGDTLLVHSGISHLGKVAGGPRAIFDLIRTCIGNNGHVLYPVFPFDSLMYTYLMSNPVFDIRTAPSKMGALTAYSLGIPDGHRSLHPTHSVIAFGPRGADFVDQHHSCDTPFAETSPFARLVEAGGKILLIGVGLNSTTSFHRTEDRLGNRFPVRVYLDEVFEVTCIDANGLPSRVTTRSHDPFISQVRDCDLVRADLLRAGVLREQNVGNGAVGLIDAAGMDKLIEELWRSRGLTIYGKLWG